MSTRHSGDEAGDPPSKPVNWSEVVSEVTQHVADVERARHEAAEAQRPRSSTPRLVAALLLLSGVLAWNVVAFTRPPEVPPIHDQEVDLRWFVADAAETIEDFRAANGRLPTPAEITGLIDEEFTFAVNGTGYVLGLEGDGVNVEYDGTVPLDEWVASTAELRDEP